MNETYNQRSVLSSVLWKLMERGGSQGLQLVIQIVLARLLMPSDYGVVVLIAIFVNIANIFVQSGLNIALIQKKEADELDFSSVFYLSLTIAGVLYLVLFFLATFIADFYNELLLVPVIRILSISLFFGALNSIQNALIAKEMAFKKQFISTLVSTIISGFIGILMAYSGYGVWALVASQLASIISITTILWFAIKWRPRLIFSFKRLEELFAFGWKMLLSSLAFVISESLYGLVIGKVYSGQLLAFYNKGDKFPSILATTVNATVSAVILPVLSFNQDEKGRIKAIVSRSVKTSSFIILPVMAGLFIVAEPLVKIILTDKWLPCVPFLQMFCIAYAFTPIQSANIQAYAAIGRSDIILKLEITRDVLILLALSIGFQFGIYMMVALKAITSIIMVGVNACLSKNLISYSYIEQSKDILPSLTISIVMAVTVYLIQGLPLNTEVVLAFQVVIGAMLYIGLAYILRIESMRYLINIIKDYRKSVTQRSL